MRTRGHEPDFIGLFVLALACGVGVGLLRDDLFIRSGPPAAMRDGSYMIAGVAGRVTAGLFFKHVERLSKPFLIMDALGTGAHGVVGGGASQKPDRPSSNYSRQHPKKSNP